MKHTIEIWRAKVKTQDSKTEELKPKRGRHLDGCLDYCATESNKRPKPSRTNYKKGKTPSLGAITTSASTNCCACCGVLAEYIKEVLRLCILCPRDTKVVELFCEMLEIGGCLCTDCYYFVKKLLCCMFSIKKC